MRSGLSQRGSRMESYRLIRKGLLPGRWEVGSDVRAGCIRFAIAPRRQSEKCRGQVRGAGDAYNGAERLKNLPAGPAIR